MASQAYCKAVTWKDVINILCISKGGGLSMWRATIGRKYAKSLPLLNQSVI